MHKNIQIINKTFPGFEQTIEFLFLNDENFRDICTDYILCIASIVNLKNEKTQQKSKTIEYKELQQDLEQEIFKIISNYNYDIS